MKKSEVKTKEDLENYYNKCRKIKFIEGTEEPNSVLQVIQRVLDYENDSESTVFTRGGHNCFADKSRSLDDVIKIVKYYYPKKSIKDVIKTILKYQKSLEDNFHFGWCPDIKKTNFRGYGRYSSFGDSNGRSSFRYQGFPNCTVNVTDYIN